MSRHQRTTPSNRIAWVDSGRGLAIVLVTLFHATNWLAGAGLNEDGWSAFNEVVATLRMPLFFTLSGLFAAKWLTVSWKTLLTKKLALFLWVFALWGAIGTGTLLIGIAARGEPINPLGALKQYLLSPLEPRLELWFIWALGLFFVLAKVTRRAPYAAQIGTAAVISALALTDWTALTGSPVGESMNVGWTGMAKYYLFFIAGLLLRQPITRAVNRLSPRRGAVILLVWLAMSLLSVGCGARAIPGFAFVTALCGVAAGFTLARALSRVPLLGFLGSRTLPIYVTHTPVIILTVAALTPLLTTATHPVLAVVLPPAVAALSVTCAVFLDTAVRGTVFRFLFTLPRRRSGGTVASPLVVLQSFPEPRSTTNPYIVMLRDALESTDGLVVRTFSWRRALWGRYDVFHVHWPEILPAGSSPLKTQLRRLTTALLLLRWRITRTAVVRTQHNIGSHEDVPFLTRALLNGITRATQLTIDLNGQTPPLGDRPQRTILHGHYREWYRHSPHPRAIPGRLSCVGLIRPYKGIGTLISAVVASPDQSISLSVAGKPINAQILDELRALAGRDPRVRLVPEFLSDDDFSRQISEAELVVLPYPAMLNSGGGLAALSLDRPVLVPDNPVTRALAEEVGHTWVQLFSGALSPEALTRALAVIRRQASGQPNLSGRTWEAAGTAHREAYREALTHRGRRVTPAPTAPEHGVRRRRTVRT